MSHEVEAMTPAQAFALRVFAQVCDGPRVLRDRLVAAGLDTWTIAGAAGCSPRTLARATDGGSTPRGVLLRLGALSVVVDQLRANGVCVDGLVGPWDERARGVLDHIAGQSDIAARVIERLGRVESRDADAQLRLAS